MNTGERLSVLLASLEERRAELAEVSRISVEEHEAEQGVVEAEKDVLQATTLVELDQAKQRAESARSDYNYLVGQRQRSIETARQNIRCAEEAIQRARDEAEREALERTASLEDFHRRVRRAAYIAGAPGHSAEAVAKAERRVAAEFRKTQAARAKLREVGKCLTPLEPGHGAWPILRHSCRDDRDRALGALRTYWLGYFGGRDFAQVGGRQIPAHATPYQLLQVRFGTLEELREVFAVFEAERRAALPPHVVDRGLGTLIWSDGVVTGNVELTIRRLPVREGSFGSDGLIVAVDERDRQMSRRDRPPAEDPEPEVEAEVDDDEDEEGETADPFPRAAE